MDYLKEYLILLFIAALVIILSILLFRNEKKEESNGGITGQYFTRVKIPLKRITKTVVLLFSLFLIPLSLLCSDIVYYQDDVAFIKKYFSVYEDVSHVDVLGCESHITIRIFFKVPGQYLDFFYEGESDMRIFPHCSIKNQTIDDCIDFSQLSLAQLGEFDTICGKTLSSMTEEINNNVKLYPSRIGEYIIRYNEIHNYIKQLHSQCTTSKSNIRQ